MALTSHLSAPKWTKKWRSGLSLNAGILTQGKDSEGDLVFSFRDACIE